MMSYYTMPGLKYRPAFIKGLDIPRIIEVISGKYGFTAEQVIAFNRRQQVRWARQVIIYILHRELKISCNVVGKHFNRDHTTVLSSCRRVENLIATERDVKEEVMRIQSIL